MRRSESILNRAIATGRRIRPVGVLACSLVFAAGASGQGTTATLNGTVRSVTGVPVAQAAVSLASVETTFRLRAATGPTGSFTVGLIPPGSWEIRVEALGYRPLIARTFTVRGGDERSLNFTLTPEQPPVTSVDTVQLAAGASSRVRPGSLQFSGDDVVRGPWRYADVAPLVAFSSAFDETLGSEGLPGDLTQVVLDGVPVYRAPHPSGRREHQPFVVVPAANLAVVGAGTTSSTPAIPGLGGGYSALATRAADQTRQLDVSGFWSGDPLWSSGESDFAAPSLLSWQGAATGAARFGEASSLSFSSTALQHESPLAPRVGGSLGGALSGLDPDVLSDLSEPAVESLTRYSGLARFDARQGSTGRVFVRGAGARTERTFAGAGPLATRGPIAFPERSTDLSFAGGLVRRVSGSSTLDIKVGLSTSRRDFDAAVEDRSPASLAESGVVLGDPLSARGESRRTDLLLLPAVRYQASPLASLSFGLDVRTSTHAMTWSDAAGGDRIYAGPDELLAGDGYLRVTEAREATFGTGEFGAFIQYEGRPAPGVQLTAGLRYGRESIGDDGPPLDTLWETTTGIRSDSLRSSFGQSSARFSLAWDPAETGRTEVRVVAEVRNGDVDTRALGEAFGTGPGRTTGVYSGSSLGWPGGSTPSAVPFHPTLTLIGPDLRPPRTAGFGVGLSQAVTGDLSLFVRGSLRRTDFLLRRRNLNTPVVEGALDPWGRQVFGMLEQMGGSVVATGSDTRRFADFGDVWALDPDGWSKYVGLTFGVEHSTPSLDLYGSYTWSETTDNWIGAGSSIIGAGLDPNLPGSDWAEGISDFDVPHRAVGGMTVRAGPAAVSAIYRFESGRPFTPGYRAGVDANGDGYVRNDVAYVEAGAELDALAQDWPCLTDQIGGFAVRNSCRTSARQSLDARVAVALGRVSGLDASLVVEGFDLIEGGGGLVDDALLLVDPDGATTYSPDGATVTIPVVVNPEFGSVVYPTGRGRMLRVGFTIGG